MCTTCGCSDGATPTLTNMQTGFRTAISLDLQANHLHTHDHAHGHDHHHSHDHGHSHAHDHTHSHDAAAARTIQLQRDVLEKNNRMAERNRGWFAGREILALNLVSSPGAGKTTLIERMIRDLKDEMHISVIEGDQATFHDAERIQATGVPVVQINTGTGCHLEADMVARALEQLAPPAGSLLLIENVGNLVCPALFDLGEHAKVVIASVTEGEDKPLKYPHMFRASELMLLNKIDLLPYVEFDVDRCVQYARQVNSSLQSIPVSAKSGEGLEEWYAWVRKAMRNREGLNRLNQPILLPR